MYAARQILPSRSIHEKKPYADQAGAIKSRFPIPPNAKTHCLRGAFCVSLPTAGKAGPLEMRILILADDLIFHGRGEPRTVSHSTLPGYPPPGTGAIQPVRCAQKATKSRCISCRAPHFFHRRGQQENKLPIPALKLPNTKGISLEWNACRPLIFIAGGLIVKAVHPYIAVAAVFLHIPHVSHTKDHI